MQSYIDEFAAFLQHAEEKRLEAVNIDEQSHHCVVPIFANCRRRRTDHLCALGHCTCHAALCQLSPRQDLEATFTTRSPSFPPEIFRVRIEIE